MNKKRVSSEKIQSTIVWQATTPTSTTGNVVKFPQKHQEAIHQELAIHTGNEEVKLKIISSGFGRTQNYSTARMQLAA
ncbi:hypothetical protein MK805_08425 [Shimazuella sp. AN120528]|uniref:hypothetical protein n=1 Tax=Shimazuella soli TaxID=1892854 RepID=UPI001F118D20|nr:hypothetical protein [Shimazuella soli]MCH5584997.1 hypothetical protein [Shimazuella soli]